MIVPVHLFRESNLQKEEMVEIINKRKDDSIVVAVVHI